MCPLLFLKLCGAHARALPCNIYQASSYPWLRESARESARAARDTVADAWWPERCATSFKDPCLLPTHAALAVTMSSCTKRGALANCSDRSTSGGGNKHDPTLPRSSRKQKMRRSTKCVQLVTEGRAKPSAMSYQMPKPICSNQGLQPESEA